MKLVTDAHTAAEYSQVVASGRAQGFRHLPRIVALLPPSIELPLGVCGPCWLARLLWPFVPTPRIDTQQFRSKAIISKAGMYTQSSPRGCTDTCRDMHDMPHYQFLEGTKS